MANKLVGVGIVVGSVIGAAPASAEPDAFDVDASLFGSLTCSCVQTVPLSGSALSDELTRGLHAGHTATMAEPPVTP
jgi:hypothetical protein